MRSSVGLLVVMIAGCNARPFSSEGPPLRAGEEIFQAECAGCHGADGISGRAPSLVEKTPRLSDDALSRVITEGVGNMPAREVHGEELDRLIAYLRETFPEQEPLPAREGAAIYAAECAGCHGD